MMLHAWNNYKLYAWGHNELSPLSKRPFYGSVFETFKFGATIVDSLDTLYVMNLKTEFEDGKAWIAENLFLNRSVSISSNLYTQIIHSKKKNFISSPQMFLYLKQIYDLLVGYSLVMHLLVMYCLWKKLVT